MPAQTEHSAPRPTFASLLVVPGFLGLIVLVAVPVSFSALTYQHAYLKSFLFQVAAILLGGHFFLGAGLDELIKRIPQLPFRRVPGLAAGWTGIHLLSALWSPRPDLVLDRTVTVAFMVILMFGTMGALRNREWRKGWVCGMAVSLVAAAGYGIWLYSQPYEQYLPALFSNRELGASFYYVPFAIALSLALVEKPQGKEGRIRWVGAGLALVFAVFIERTQSSAALGCLALMLVGVFCSSPFRKFLWVVLALMCAAIGLVAVRTGFYSLREFTGTLSESSIGVRLGFWQATWRLYMGHPLLGVGGGAFVAAIAPFRSPESFGHALATPALHHAHCFALETLAELGPLGLLLFAGLALAILRECHRASLGQDKMQRALARGCFWGLAAMLAHSFVGVGFAYPEVQAVFWLGAGLVLSLDLPAFPAENRPWGLGRICLVFFTAVFFIGMTISAWRGIDAQMLLSKAIHQKRATAESEEPLRERIGGLEQAVDRLSRVTREERLQIPAYHHLANAWDLKASLLAGDSNEQKRWWKEAIAVQEEFLRLYPDYGLAHRTLAQLYLKQGNYSEAIRQAKRQVQLNPFDVVSYQVWHIAAQKAGAKTSLTEALASLRKALEIRPDDVALQYLEGGTLLLMGKKSEAGKSMARLAADIGKRLEKLRGASSPEALRLRLYLVRIWLQDYPEKAIPQCQFILSVQPGHREARRLLEWLKRGTR